MPIGLQFMTFVPNKFFFTTKWTFNKNKNSVGQLAFVLKLEINQTYILTRLRALPLWL